ncbi:MAG: hypothetical protein JW993_06580 [Sedimentisphaerales bacterium]|nr:hypothetical protein [Sedimentisphaerales bacterium]
MTSELWGLLGSFTTPIQIDTTASSMLWLVPLVASIAIVYKATKVYTIRWKAFLRESAVLFGSIMVFIIAAALIIQAVAWLVTEQLPRLLGGPSF